MELTCQNIRFVPIVHQRIGFAEAVRREALRWRPDAIAVELPPTLLDPIIRGINRLPRISAVAWHEPGCPGELVYLPIDPCDGIIEAARLATRHQIELALIDLDLPGLRARSSHAPDDLIADRAGLERYVEAYAAPLAADPTDPANAAREAEMARRLRALADRRQRVLCVIGLGHYLNVRARLESNDFSTPAPLEPVTQRPGAALFDLHPRALDRALGESPGLTWLREQQREEQELTGECGFDAIEGLLALLRRAGDIYEATYRGQISLIQWQGLLQFARNLALLGGRLRPDLVQAILAARGIVDGDYAWELLKLLRQYPPQQAESPDGLPRLRLRRGRAAIEGAAERFSARPHWGPEPGEELKLQLRRRRPRPELLEEWKREWESEPDPSGLCDWPNESERQEQFMHHVRRRALELLTDNRSRTEPFAASLLDGLDLRETIRNWHQGRLHVRREHPPNGKVGAAVIIFEDQPIEHFPDWRATLYAEHAGESDISFFTTPLGEHVVGPRISRVQFNGLLSVWPANYIPDIWLFPFGEGIKTCGDALLTAAILFSAERYIAWVAPHPPSQPLRRLARRHHHHIIHLPLHTFPREKLRRIRRCHVLLGRDVRAWARDYIFDE